MKGLKVIRSAVVVAAALLFSNRNALVFSGSGPFEGSPNARGGNGDQNLNLTIDL